MKLALSAAVLALATVAPSALAAEAAPAASSGVSNYVSLGLGTGIVGDGDFDAFGPGIETGYDDFPVDFVAAYGWKGAINEQFGWRAEAEFGWQWAKLDDIHLDGEGSLPVDGDAHQLAVSGNGYIDWNFAKDWSAYAGLGLGGNWTTIDMDLMGTGLDADAFGFHLQAMLGAAWQVDSNIAVFAEYRYIHSFTDAEGNVEGTDFELNIGPSHNLIVGVRFGV